MKTFSSALLLAGSLLYCAPSHAAEPLVNSAWVKDRIGKPGVVFLDVRPARETYAAGHVPGAVYTDYVKDGWRVERNGVPGELPETDKVEALIGRLGIDNRSHVVLLPGGFNSTEMAAATRIYWTFKIMGHDAVSILDGGMAAYAADKQSSLEKNIRTPEPKTFTAKPRLEMLANVPEVEKAVGTRLLLDHRPNDQFIGVNKSSSVKKYGTIPGAVNVPTSWTTEDDGGTFRDRDTLRALYRAAGAPTEGPVINFCNTGHWASLGWFISHELLGNKDAKLYDGSMAEWVMNPARPVEKKFKTP